MTCIHGIPFESTYPAMTCDRCAAIAAGAHLTDGDQERPGDKCRLCGMVAEAAWHGVGWRGECPGHIEKELVALRDEFEALRRRFEAAYRRRDFGVPELGPTWPSGTR